MKPHFFRRRDDWSASRLDGFQLERAGGVDRVRGRFSGREFGLTVEEGRFRYTGDGFALVFDPERPAETLEGEGPQEVDLTYCFLMDYLRRALLDTGSVNYVRLAAGG